jgi:DNA-binding MarR family transcriptional regulator
MTGELFSADVVALMRGDVARLGDDPANAMRLVLRHAGSLDALLAQARRALGTNGNEFSALLSSWDGGRCTISEVALRVGLQRATLTSMIDRLEALGLVERLPDPTDRRTVLCNVTPRFERELWGTLERYEEALRGIAADEGGWPAFASAVDRLHAESWSESRRLRVEFADAERTRTSPRRGRRARTAEDASW